MPTTVLLVIPGQTNAACQWDSSLSAGLCQDPAMAEFDELTIPTTVRPVTDRAPPVHP